MPKKPLPPSADMLAHTPLIDVHRELSGRLVDFAGWELPIHYEGVIAEHTWCRKSAGLFDVSHMGVVELRGEDPAVSLEHLTPAAITSLKVGRMRYALLTNDEGGVIDDFMITNRGDHLVLVLNAARREVDLAHLRKSLPEIDFRERNDVALLALQGPKAVDVLARLAPEVNDLFFLQAANVTIADTAVFLSRAGYTGEDGFELMVPADEADRLARLLLAAPEVKPCGLGARDTLRLEAGLCLYGNDIDESTSLVEADLKWTTPRRRRVAKDFPGADRTMAEWDDAPSRLRVGLIGKGRRLFRSGATLRTTDGEQVGIVTSGGYGPSLERPIGMGYVAPVLAEAGTALVADVRGKNVDVAVCALPFAEHNYVRPSKASSR